MSDDLYIQSQTKHVASVKSLVESMSICWPSRHRVAPAKCWDPASDPARVQQSTPSAGQVSTDQNALMLGNLL